MCSNIALSGHTVSSGIPLTYKENLSTSPARTIRKRPGQMPAPAVGRNPTSHYESGRGRSSSAGDASGEVLRQHLAMTEPRQVSGAARAPAATLATAEPPADTFGADLQREYR